MHTSTRSQDNENGHPLAYSIKDACRVSSLGRTKIFALISSGRLAHSKVGKRTLIPAESLQKLINEGA